MGVKRHVARQQSQAAEVAFGSKGDMRACQRHVRFTPERRHCRATSHRHLITWCDMRRDGPAAIDLPTCAEEEQVRLSVRPSAFQSEMILFSSLRRLGCILRYYMRRP